MENICFTDPVSGEENLFYVLEQTCIGGVNYLLVTEDEEEDSYAYILKEIQTDGDEIIYAMVEDDVEMSAISKVFAEMLEDVDFDCREG